jgi:lipopolysaccharide export LptBFGC system permease protein LptF
MLTEMDKQLVLVLYAVAMVVIIVAVDVAFLRDRFAARLAVNIGIVVVFAAVYFSFLKHY